MRRTGFTMIEMLLATMLVGVLTTLSILTFQSVTHSWQASTDYMDKLQRTDYALNQVISGLRSMYYPHDGKQDDRYGFVLTDNGDGDRPRNSDVIEWSKTGPAIVGTKIAIADTVHRVQVMVLEEGDNDWETPIQKTGLYARLMGDSALIPKDDKDETDYTFGNDELYQPILISDGVVGIGEAVALVDLAVVGIVHRPQPRDDLVDRVVGALRLVEIVGRDLPARRHGIEGHHRQDRHDRHEQRGGQHLDHREAACAHCVGALQSVT